jgi:hypothetical protein
MAPTEASLKEIVELLQRQRDPAYVDGLDQVLGFFIVLTPAVLGPQLLPLLALLGPKNELVKVLRGAIGRLTKKEDEQAWERTERLRRVHVLIVHQAIVEALGRTCRDLAEVLGQGEELHLTPAAEVGTGSAAQAAELVSAADVSVPVPHPIGGYGGWDGSTLALEQLFGLCASSFRAHIRSAPEVAAADRRSVDEVLERIEDRMFTSYQGLYVGLSAEYEELRLWRTLLAFEEGGGSDLPASLRAHRDAADRIDAGFERLADLIVTADQGAVAPVVERLHRAARAEVERPIVDQGIEGAPDGLSFPSRARAFVPQAFRATVHRTGGDRLEQEETWGALREHQGLGAFLISWFTSAYSAVTPLLVLGHPGSGKSILTRMLAARLAGPGHTCVRIELRDVDAEADVQAMIEQAVLDATGHQVRWADLRDAPGGPPVVIFDGFDELLQATGEAHRRFLERIAAFQEREADLDRPVRAVVTSRLSLIDQARIPDGATVIRLSEFDPARQQMWADIWNASNQDHFRRTGVEPLSLDHIRAEVRDLARQPLLLLMIALFDSSANDLRRADALDTTMLYERLLRDFIARERAKEDGAEGFAARSVADQADLVEADLERLSVLAVGMFNRRSLSISRRELLADLEALGDGDTVAQRASPLHLSEADLLLGRFFFVHEAAAGPEKPATDEFARLEFLHNTFGEFLTCRFIVGRLVRACARLATLASSPELGGDLRSAFHQGGLFPASWYRALSHAGLFERPVIARMCEAWIPHALEAGGLDVEDATSAWRALVHGELHQLLDSERGARGFEVEPGQVPWPASRRVREATYLANLAVLVGAWAGTAEVDVAARSVATDHLDRPESEDRAATWTAWRSAIAAGTTEAQRRALAATLVVDQFGGHLGIRLVSADDGGAALTVEGWQIPSRLCDHAAAARGGILLMTREEVVDPARLVAHLGEAGLAPPDAAWMPLVRRLPTHHVAVSDRRRLRHALREAETAAGQRAASSASVWFDLAFGQPQPVRPSRTAPFGAPVDPVVGALGADRRVDDAAGLLDWLVLAVWGHPIVLRLARPPRALIEGASAVDVQTRRLLDERTGGAPQLRRIPEPDVADALAVSDDPRVAAEWPELRAEVLWGARLGDRAHRDPLGPLRRTAVGLACSWFPTRMVELAFALGDERRGRAVVTTLSDTGFFVHPRDEAGMRWQPSSAYERDRLTRAAIAWAEGLVPPPG